MMLFCMAVGSPPYAKPSNDDDTFKYYIRNGQIEKLLFQWNKHSCVTVKLVDLVCYFVFNCVRCLNVFSRLFFR